MQPCPMATWQAEQEARLSTEADAGTHAFPLVYGYNHCFSLHHPLPQRAALHHSLPQRATLHDVSAETTYCHETCSLMTSQGHRRHAENSGCAHSFQSCPPAHPSPVQRAPQWLVSTSLAPVSPSPTRASGKNPHGRVLRDQGLCLHQKTDAGRMSSAPGTVQGPTDLLPAALVPRLHPQGGAQGHPGGNPYHQLTTAGGTLT